MTTTDTDNVNDKCVWCRCTFTLTQPLMEAQSNRTSTMFSPLHFHINLRLVRVVVGVCVCVYVVCVVYRSVTCGGTAAWSSSLLHCTLLGVPIDDGNPVVAIMERWSWQPCRHYMQYSVRRRHGVVLLREVFHMFGELPVDVLRQYADVGEQWPGQGCNKSLFCA